jgi:glycosyltransferase involved in cell wall biosynthesis
MPRRLRIAVLGCRGIPSAYSGVERVVEGLYCTLAERGHEITVYGRPDCAPNGVAMYRGVRVIGTPTIESRSLGTALQVSTGALSILREGKYDLVHTHAQAAGLVVPVLKRFGVPVVSTIHGIDWQRAKWAGLGARVLQRAERWIVRATDEMVVISRDLEAYYRDRYGRATRYIPNATDLTDDVPIDVERLARFGVSPGRYVISVSRLVPEKRIEDLICAFRALDTAHRLLIVGGSSHTDDYVARLQREAEGDHRIVFTGPQPRDTVVTLLRGAELYVLPSELEGMPISLLEALEMGLPSLVSRLPVHEEILGSIEGYDLFFPARDVRGLRDRLSHALAHASRYRQLACRIQAHVRAHYTWPAIADQTEDLYRRLLVATEDRSRPLRGP